jgi:hypothetical protein
MRRIVIALIVIVLVVASVGIGVLVASWPSHTEVPRSHLAP